MLKFLEVEVAGVDAIEIDGVVSGVEEPRMELKCSNAALAMAASSDTVCEPTRILAMGFFYARWAAWILKNAELVSPSFSQPRRTC